MARSLSRGKIEAVSNGVFLIGLGALFYTGFWWPGILLVIWAMLAVRQLLSERKFDFVISTIILGGVFLISYFNLQWDMILPGVFVLGGIYLIVREYLYSEKDPEERR